MRRAIKVLAIIALAMGFSAVPIGATAAAGATADGLGPDDLARAYHLPADPGRAGTVGIIEMGDAPRLAADLAEYRRHYRLPTCEESTGCLRIVGEHGGPPATTVDESMASETTVDADMVSAACPRCRIVVVELPIPANMQVVLALPASTANAFADGVDTAIRLGANAVSISFIFVNGFQPDITTGAAGLRLRHPGVAVVVASGDNGFVPGLVATENWPQGLPWVISVGGVELTSRDGGRTFTKRVWRNPDLNMTSGSACSTLMGPAIGQPANIAALCGGHRAGADISAAATGVAVYFAGSWATGFGTSAAAPYIAGLYARAGTAGVDGPNTIYRADPSAFEDVTEGSNVVPGSGIDCRAVGVPARLCEAAPGWDGPTGRGVPNGLGAL